MLNLSGYLNQQGLEIALPAFEDVTAEFWKRALEPSSSADRNGVTNSETSIR